MAAFNQKLKTSSRPGIEFSASCRGNLPIQELLLWPPMNSLFLIQISVIGSHRYLLASALLCAYRFGLM